MAALNFTITNAGLTLLSNVSTVGPVTITKVAIGSAGYVETASQTALVTQIKQLTPDGSSVTAPGIIHITASDSSTDAYSVKEIGLYAGTTLFAIYSDTTAFLTKTATNTALFSVDLVLSNVPAGVLTTGLVSSNNSLTISSSITNAQVGVAFVQAGNNTALSVAVSGNNITVNLATGSTGAITSTASAVRTAILANTSAAALVSVANTSGSSGAGIVTAFAMTYLASVTIGQAVFNYPSATESTAGVAKIATTALVTAGTDDSTMVTPLKLANRLSSLPSAFVRLVGDSMTGFLTLVGDPTAALHAATKQYVDTLHIGAVNAFAMSSAPAGWLKANGAAVSRTSYSALFSAIGTTYGVGDGSTTFNLPDLRGEFLRGYDDGRGIDAGRTIGSYQADAFQGHRHAATTAANQNSGGSPHNIPYGTGLAETIYFGSSTVTVTDPTTDTTNGTPRTGAETRPRNRALLFCIKF